MVKVKDPLFSESASGKLGGILQYFCGHYAKKAITKKETPTEAQGTQRSKFQIGSEKWTDELSLETKEKWRIFVGFVYRSKDCVGAEFKLNGYQAWLSYFLSFGVDGWTCYPDPPVRFH